MRCHNCGNEIPEQSIFCGICGSRLVPEPPVITEIPETSAEPKAPAASETPEVDEVVIIEEQQVSVTENEPEIEPIEEAPEAPEAPEASEAPAVSEQEQYADRKTGNGGFVIKHCPNCGAALISGAKFCSNCGQSMHSYEQRLEYKTAAGGIKSYRARLVMVISALVAAAALLCGAQFLLGCHSIEGEWEVANSGGGLFDMFSSSYLDFNDDGHAVYYNGIFSARRYNYTYNRFTKVLILKSSGERDSVLHIDWIDKDNCVIRELNMHLVSIGDIPYSDDEFTNNDAVRY